MKKHSYKILLALSLLGLLAACAKPEQEVVEKKALSVLTTDVIFGVEGGTGSIVVEADETVTATSERPWCQVSVDGKKIQVSVTEANPSRMSRYSRITVKAGSSEVHVTAQQFGEIFNGLDLKDESVSEEGTVLIYKYHSNVSVAMSSDVDWIHFEMVEDEEEGTLVKVIVDPNPGLTRFGHISYTAGTNTGSADFMQWPTPQLASGWDISITDGMYDFPNQIDEVTVTVPNNSQLYQFELVTKDQVMDESAIPGKAMTMALETMNEIKAKMADGSISSPGDCLKAGSFSERHENMPRSIWGLVIAFDDRGIPTGEYYCKDLQIPDRGPKKQLVDGWEISHVAGTYVHPDQLDQFTVKPKAGYEDVKYIATAVRKDAVADVEDFAFTTFAMTTREEILAKVASGELASFEAGLSSGESTFTVKNLPVGDVYVVVVAFGDNKFYTGDYGFETIGVDDAKRAFWIGTWALTNEAGDSYTCTIKEKEDESGYLTMACNGLYTGTGALLTKMNWVDLRCNEDGTLTVFAQIHEEMSAYYNATYGDIYPGFYGFYTNAEGKVYYKTNAPYDIFDLTFGAGGTATVINVRLASGDIPYDSVAIRYWSSEKGSRFSFTSNKTIKLAGLTLTKQ